MEEPLFLCTRTVGIREHNRSSEECPIETRVVRRKVNIMGSRRLKRCTSLVRLYLSVHHPGNDYNYLSVRSNKGSENTRVSRTYDEDLEFSKRHEIV